tara:strand:+ start:4459 stop:4995 length:537 start_codon:yes stop_codon:yes gene_type:complete
LIKKQKKSSGLLWITGLSGSGKSTISLQIKKILSKRYSNIILLDGDVLRKKLKIKKKLFFSYQKRKILGLKYVELCKEFINKDKFVIIAAMALIKDVQRSYKKIKNNTDVFLDVPINELKKRDPKKLYKKYFAGKIKNMAGLDLKYDIPKKPSIFIKWNKSYTKNKIIKKILYVIGEK